MANSEEEVVFPEADAGVGAVEEELNPGQQKKNLQVEHVPDPSIVAEAVASFEIEKKEESETIKKQKEKKDGMEALKSTIIVSGILVALVGAVYAITKKLREK